MTSIDPNKVNLAERDIEDWLYENPESVGVRNWVGRQFQVPSGIIDLLGMDNHDIPVVVEVKNVEASSDAILQVCRYASDIQDAADTACDYQYETYVKKIVVCKGNISSKILYEANAVKVTIRSFVVNLSLSVSGTWTFTEEKDSENWKALSKLSELPLFHDFTNYARYLEHQAEIKAQEKAQSNDSLPEAFKDFIEKHTDDDGDK